MYITAGESTIWLDREGFASLEEYLKTEAGCRKVYVLTDTNTLQYCWPVVEKYFRDYCTVDLITIEPGEHRKSLETATYIWNVLLEKDAGRSALMVNLGGGVICDLGGFSAALYKRGIEFINIPTTLLAMVDASVGGKNGVDLNGLKNMIGTFTDPSAVFINDEFLTTLDKRQVMSGFAEALKHALIDNVGYWNYLQTFDFTNYDRLIFKSVEIKKNIVTGDYRDNQERKKLNFGHTIGHAIESLYLNSRPEPLLHGEAVAAGMICETRISAAIGLLDPVQATEIIAAIRKHYAQVHFTTDEITALATYICQDKKMNGANHNFTLLEEIGLARIGQDVPNETIRESLEYYISLE